MSLSNDEVEKIAYLARLQIDAKDVPQYTQDLSGILELVEQMEAVDTEGVKPMAHPQDITQRLRDDEVTETDQREKFQEIAPLTESGLYLVPKVLD
ncbi:MAG: Asp-tRNA(Asn)/Glu-tRNA(Gln) amidotransferase GatCAB subunit C [Thiothrix sp.]|nr:MAG: Asp-tRNA(Asn)/Glu-tRNA(Gln) amidotransferase GatCAB subunit C [Thiothrix sp.]